MVFLFRFLILFCVVVSYFFVQICYNITFHLFIICLSLQQIKFSFSVNILIFKVMTKRNSGANGVKNTSTKKSVKVSFAADVLTKESNQLNAVTAAAVAGASSHAVSLAVGAGLASAASVPAGRANDVANLMDQEIKLMEFRTKVANHWAAPEWSGAAALRDLLSASGLSADQIAAAVAAAGRKSGEDLAAVCPSVADVCEYISTNFESEFRQLCGCAVPAPAAVAVYSYTELSVSTITVNSDINDYFTAASVPAGASASAVVSAVLSVRVLVDLRRRFAAARAAARNNFKDCMSLAARRALGLGLSAAVAARYFSLLLSAVPAADDREEKRLRKNLASCRAALAALDMRVLVLCPAVSDIDTAGAFFVPAGAVLPASAPAKVRKLWAKRVRLLSSISTLETLLSRC